MPARKLAFNVVLGDRDDATLSCTVRIWAETEADAIVAAMNLDLEEPRTLVWRRAGQLSAQGALDAYVQRVLPVSAEELSAELEALAVQAADFVYEFLEYIHAPDNELPDPLPLVDALRNAHIPLYTEGDSFDALDEPQTGEP